MIEGGQRDGAMLHAAVEVRVDVRGHQEWTGHGAARGDTGWQRKRPLHGGDNLREGTHRSHTSAQTSTHCHISFITPLYHG